jgi:predicted kinase
MRRLILIFGDLASGKSTFADILSKRTGIPAIKKDRIKEILADTVGFETREENLALSRATFEIMLHIFERSAEAGEGLILESNFREGELKRLAAIADEAGYKILSLYLTADTKLLYGRFNERRKMGRHRAHLTAEFESFEGFETYLIGQRAEYIPGDIVRINADNFSYQTDDKILNFVDLFLKN